MHGYFIVILASSLSPCDASPPLYGLYQIAEVSDPIGDCRHPISQEEIEDLTRAGVKDDVIIAAVRRSGMIVPVHGVDLIGLWVDGVHSCVVEAIQVKANLQPPAFLTPLGPPPPPVGVGMVLRRK
jgi:hypothetical protein